MQYEIEHYPANKHRSERWEIFDTSQEKVIAVVYDPAALDIITKALGARPASAE